MHRVDVIAGNSPPNQSPRRKLNPKRVPGRIPLARDAPLPQPETGFPMNKLLALLITGLLASGAFAAAHMGTAPATSAANPMPAEAMKAGDPKAEAKAQAKVDAKMKAGD